MSSNDVAIRFNKVTFEYRKDKPILDEASFAIRRGAKFTIMGQNGAGKSTILSLITGALKPNDGSIYVDPDLVIAHAPQVIPREDLELTTHEFFEKCFTGAALAKAANGKDKIYDLDRRIDAVLETVGLQADHGKKIEKYSGGQQARLLLASALIQDPDLLILDEPTNNLDAEGIGQLMIYLMESDKTCIVISHDADFLNCFTDGVLYLDVFTKKIHQHLGDYFTVVEEIAAEIEKEERKNAQYEKEILANKEKANFFANKGGKMRLVARKMRDKAAEMEAAKVVVRKEDKAIRHFEIPCQENLTGEIINISSLKVMRNHEPTEKQVRVSLKKNQHLLLSGPNGIGKTTLLESLVNGTAKGAKIAEGVKVGYYRQDFSNLDFEKTVFDTLTDAMGGQDEERLRSVAAGFLLTKETIYSKIDSLSEGQKGLVSFARLLLEEPGLLILDEPTNHINFRHLPVIAQALDAYKGALILVSHVPEFVSQIRIDEMLDLEK
jgi:ATPase subunit of ABC transporter with duplicated ATPase domains